MEIELKYSIEDEKTASKILDDPDLNLHMVKDSKTIENLKANYYDTSDFDLQNGFIAFRVRKEGKKRVATVKWNGNVDGPLHKRNELNINLGEGTEDIVPTASFFGESEIGQKMIEIIGDKDLITIMSVNVLRQSFRVEINNTLMEVSIDNGQIITDNGNALISELEIELFSGSDEELLKLGDKIKERYNLEPGLNSKFARGLALLNRLEL